MPDGVAGDIRPTPELEIFKKEKKEDMPSLLELGKWSEDSDTPTEDEIHKKVQKPHPAPKEKGGLTNDFFGVCSDGTDTASGNANISSLSPVSGDIKIILNGVNAPSMFNFGGTTVSFKKSNLKGLRDIEGPILLVSMENIEFDRNFQDILMRDYQEDKNVVLYSNKIIDCTFIPSGVDKGLLLSNHSAIYENYNVINRPGFVVSKTQIARTDCHRGRDCRHKGGNWGWFAVLIAIAIFIIFIALVCRRR